MYGAAWRSCISLINEELVLQKAEVSNFFVPLATRLEAFKIATAKGVRKNKSQRRKYKYNSSFSSSKGAKP